MANPRFLSNTFKGVCSVISGVLINLLTGSIFAFPNLITYYEAYSNYTIGRTKLLFVAPAGIFILNSFPSFTGILDDKFRVRILTIVGSLCLLSSQLIMYFSKNYILLIISYCLFGVCGSLTYFQSLKNCWKYFPNKKGLISGIIFSSFGLSAFIFTFLADEIIKKDGTTAEKANGFKQYLKIFIICIIVMGTLSSLLSFPYTKEKDYLDNSAIIPSDGDNSKEQDSDKDIFYENKDNENQYSDQLKNKNEKKESENLTLKESLLSRDFFLCLTIASCTLIFGFFLTNTYRLFGTVMFIEEPKTSKEKFDEAKLNKNLQDLSKVFTLLNTFSRLVWGYLSDKIRFKILYSIVCINQLICGSLIYFSAKNMLTYYIVVNFGVLSFSGHVILFPTLIHTKFGVENSVYLLGICGIFVGTAALIGPVITIFVLKKSTDYLIIYIAGAAPTIISLIIELLIKVDQKQNQKIKNANDNYDDEEEDLTKEKEEKSGLELN